MSTNSIRSGKIAAYLELRDNTLVQAQAQVDQFAASMSSALSDKTTDGHAAPASVRRRPAIDLDLTGLQTGNVIHVTYKDNMTGVTHNLSIVRVDDPSVLPLQQHRDARSERRSARHRFLRRHGLGGFAAQRRARGERQPAVLQSFGLDAARARRRRAEPVGRHCGLGDDDDVVADSAATPQLPLFTDNGEALYRRDHRQRLAADRSCRPHQRQHRAARRSLAHHRLFDQSADAGRRHHALRLHSDAVVDAALSLFAADRHRHDRRAVHRHAANFAKQFISQQGEAATSAKQLADGQDVVLNTLQKKMNATSGVNIDDEMAHLLALQNAYSANARVMSSIKQMYDMLMQSM